MCPFPGITDKCGNSDFPAAWLPVIHSHSVQQVFVRVTATCFLLMFHSFLRRKSAWTGDVDAVSHSTYSNLQYCFRTHYLELTAPRCIKWLVPIWGRGQYWSSLRLKCDGTRAETRFRLSAKRTSPIKSAGASVQSTTGSRGVRISGSNGSNAGYTMFQGSVKSTDYPVHLSVSPSPPPPPCVTACHHISTGLQQFMWYTH
jgi:hypothetical protein